MELKLLKQGAPMTNRPDSGTRCGAAEHGLRQTGLDTGPLAGDGPSLAGGQRPRECSMPNLPALLVPVLGAALILLLSFTTGGCMRQLSVQDEYFAPGSGPGTRSRVAAQHLVSHHRAMQVAQRSCSVAPTHSDIPPGDAQPPAGPEMGSSAAREALRRLCASIPPQLPVAAHGASSNAYQRWVQDAVRELPAASETAASAAGGS